MSHSDLLGGFEHAVLLTVARLGGEGYGTSIRREIAERTGRDVSVGALYTTLNRLTHKGFVASRMGRPTAMRGGRAKRFYRVEPAGLEALREAQSVLESLWDGLDLEAGESAS